MDERIGPKLSQKGVSSIATHLQTRSKMKAAPGQWGKDPAGWGTEFTTELAGGGKPVLQDQLGRWLNVTLTPSFHGLRFFIHLKRDVDPSYLQKRADDSKRKGESPLQSLKMPYSAVLLDCQ